MVNLHALRLTTENVTGHSFKRPMLFHLSIFRSKQVTQISKRKYTARVSLNVLHPPPLTNFRTSAGGVFPSEALQISAAALRLLVVRAIELLHGSRYMVWRRQVQVTGEVNQNLIGEKTFCIPFTLSNWLKTTRGS